MLKKIAALTVAVSVLSLSGTAQADGWSRKNIFGGQDYYSSSGKYMGQSTPNVFGGYTGCDPGSNNFSKCNQPESMTQLAQLTSNYRKGVAMKTFKLITPFAVLVAVFGAGFWLVYAGTSQRKRPPIPPSRVSRP